MRSIPLFVVVLAACAPNLAFKTSRVDADRIVAVIAQPAEAKPNANVHWTAIVVSPGGVVADWPIDWNFCVVPRAPTDSATISTECLAPPPPDLGIDALDAGPPVDAGPLPDGAVPDAGLVPLVPLAQTGMVQVASRIPSDACAKVGPQVPPAAADGSRQRPPDPDVTGGYYLPIRMTLGDELAFARQRLRCALPDVPGQTATDFAAQYHNNTNPVIHDVLVDGVVAPTDGTHVPIDYAAPITITLEWEPDSIEDYVVVDPASRTLVGRTETFTVEWFTNGGAMDHDRTIPVDFITSPNTFQIDPSLIPAPSACADDLTCDDRSAYCAHAQCFCDRGQCTRLVTVWIVLKDDRGGVAAASLVFTPM